MTLTWSTIKLVALSVSIVLACVAQADATPCRPGHFSHHVFPEHPNPSHSAAWVHHTLI